MEINAVHIAVLSMLVLAGCTSTTSNIPKENIVLAEEYCDDKGGLKKISTNIHTEPVFHCENGTVIGTDLLIIRMTGG